MLRLHFTAVAGCMGREFRGKFGDRLLYCFVVKLVQMHFASQRKDCGVFQEKGEVDGESIESCGFW